MTARQKKRVADGVAWLQASTPAIAGMLALLTALVSKMDSCAAKKGAEQAGRAVSVLAEDNAEVFDSLAVFRRGLGRLDRRVGRLERRDVARPRTRLSSASADTVEVVARKVGPLDVLAAPFKGLFKLFGGG